jgi:hypothetical protein
MQKTDYISLSPEVAVSVLEPDHLPTAWLFEHRKHAKIEWPLHRGVLDEQLKVRALSIYLVLHYVTHTPYKDNLESMLKMALAGIPQPKTRGQLEGMLDGLVHQLSEEEATGVLAEEPHCLYDFSSSPHFLAALSSMDIPSRTLPETPSNLP